MTEQGAVDADQTPTDVTSKAVSPEVAEDASDEGQNDQLKQLLKEKRLEQRKRQEAQAELRKIKDAALQEQGKYKELYDALRDKHEGLQRSVLEREIDTNVKLKAKDSGCVDVDALLKLGNRSLLQYDEETGEVHGTELFVEDARKNYAYLFSSQSKPVINPSTPGGVRLSGQTKTYDKMSLNELHEEAKRLSKK